MPAFDFFKTYALEKLISDWHFCKMLSWWVIFKWFHRLPVSGKVDIFVTRSDGGKDYYFVVICLNRIVVKSRYVNTALLEIVCTHLLITNQYLITVCAFLPFKTDIYNSRKANLPQLEGLLLSLGSIFKNELIVISSSYCQLLRNIHLSPVVESASSFIAI